MHWIIADGGELSWQNLGLGTFSGKLPSQWHERLYEDLTYIR